jgi:HlyD family secretion protein
MNRRLIDIGVELTLVATLAAACSTAGGQTAGASGAAERTATVETGAIEVWIETTGEIAPAAQAALTFDVSGVVGPVNVAVGDRVRSGEVLLQLDSESLDSSLITAQADLLDAQQGLEDLLEPPTTLELAQAEEAVLDAQEAVEDAQRHLDGVKYPDVEAYQEALDDAVIALTNAESGATITEVGAETGQVIAAQDAVDRAGEQLGAVQSAEEGCGNCDPDRMAQAQDNYNGAVNSLTTAQLNLQTAQNADQQALRDAQEAVQDAQDSLAAAQAGPKLSEVALAEAELATAEGQYDQAVADLNDLREGPSESEIAAAEARVAAAQARADQVRLVAPFNGTVTSIAYEPGDSVSPGQRAIVIAALDQLHVDTLVDELDIAQVGLGQEVSLTLDALPGVSLAGEVVEIDQSPAEGADTTEYPVRVELTSADESVRIGMTAAVNILAARKEGVVLVPNWALRADPNTGETVVSVQSGGGPVSVPVTLGLRSETHSEVLSGLEAGDVAVVAVTPEAPSGGLFGGD